MATTVLAIANQKGGVGKTTTAIHLAAALGERGHATLLIDLDPQANATSALGHEKTPGVSLYPALTREEAAADHIQATRHKNLSLLPGEVDLAALETELRAQEDYLSRVKAVLKPLKKSGRYRVLVLDCPPSLGLISLNALAASDYLLVALQCEYLALEGLGQILGVVDSLKDAGVTRKLALGGIVMTMHDPRTRLSRQVVDEVQQHLPEALFKSLIPRSVRLAEAPSYGQTIFEYDRFNRSARAYRKLAREVEQRFALK